MRRKGFWGKQSSGNFEESPGYAGRCPVSHDRPFAEEQGTAGIALCYDDPFGGFRLALEIQREAQRANRAIDILLEINVAGEESKFGFSPEEVMDALSEIRDFSNVHVCGLMTIAPFVENSEENRPIFKKLFQLCVDIKRKNIDNSSMAVLSMGMTGDYVVAVEEGATMVRVGTGIFGAR